MRNLQKKLAQGRAHRILSSRERGAWCRAPLCGTPAPARRWQREVPGAFEAVGSRRRASARSVGRGLQTRPVGQGTAAGVAARSRRFGFLPPVLHGATLPARAELGQNAQDYYGQLV